jgi:hypothetical protein
LGPRTSKKSIPSPYIVKPFVDTLAVASDEIVAVEEGQKKKAVYEVSMVILQQISLLLIIATKFSDSSLRKLVISDESLLSLINTDENKAESLSSNASSQVQIKPQNCQDLSVSQIRVTNKNSSSGFLLFSFSGVDIECPAVGDEDGLVVYDVMSLVRPRSQKHKRHQINPM